jgi:CheY-like chemotaxis protein
MSDVSKKPEENLPTSRPNDFILALTEDLILIPRLEDAVHALGFEALIVDQPTVLGAQGSPVARITALTEPLEGPDAVLVQRLVERRPALILVDLTARSVPWARWIQVLKTSAATRRIPILAFGPHVNREAFQQASDLGADHVLTRGQFHASLVEILRKWVKVPEYEALATSCQGELSETAKKGLDCIKTGDYYDAHEFLEHAWMEAPEHEGTLYRALLQISVAYLHIVRENHAGAVKMMLRVHQWLDPLPNECRRVDVAALRDQLETVSIALGRVGSEGVSSFDRTLLRPIPMCPR